MKFTENCTRDPLNLYKYYKKQNPTGELGPEFFEPNNPSPSLYLNNKELFHDPWSRESMEYLINTVTSKIGGYKKLGYLKYCQPVIMTKEVSKVKYDMDESLTIWEVFTLEPFTKNWDIPYGFNKRLRATDKYRRWRSKIVNGKTHCEICYRKEEYLIAHHDPEFDALLKMFRIKCTDGKGNLDFRDAYNCKALWSSGIGMAVCEKCHCEIHEWLRPSGGNTPSGGNMVLEPSNDISNGRGGNAWRWSYLR
jgi:hypothetical protein